MKSDFQRSIQLKCCAEISPPSLVLSSLRNRTDRVSLTSQVILTCEAEGEPPPSTSWYKDGNLVLNHSDTLEIRQLHSSHKLGPLYYIESHRFINLKSHLKVCLTTHVRSFFVNDTGVYSCISHNIAGSVARFIDLQYEPIGKPHFILSLDTDINIKQFSRTQTWRQLESNPYLLLLPPVWPPDHVIFHSLLFQKTQSKIIKQGRMPIRCGYLAWEGLLS